MSWQIGAIVLTACAVMTLFPEATVGAQDDSASTRKALGADPRMPRPPRQVSREFLSRLFPVKGRMYGDRHALPTRDWAPKDSRPIEQFEDKEAAQQFCWGICTQFLKDWRYLQDSGITFAYLPPDDFDRKRWRGGGNNPDRLGRHIAAFKRNGMFVTVVIQEDMIALTFEYKVDPSELELPLAEVQKRIAAICPFIGDLVLGKMPQEEDRAGWSKAGLGIARTRDSQQIDPDWIRSVRWWQEPGRFGIASTTHRRKNDTGRIFRAPYLGD